MFFNGNERITKGLYLIFLVNTFKQWPLDHYWLKKCSTRFGQGEPKLRTMDMVYTHIWQFRNQSGEKYTFVLLKACGYCHVCFKVFLIIMLNQRVKQHRAQIHIVVSIQVSKQRAGCALLFRLTCSSVHLAKARSAEWSLCVADGTLSSANEYSCSLSLFDNSASPMFTPRLTRQTSILK